MLKKITDKEKVLRFFIIMLVYAINWRYILQVNVTQVM